MQQAAAPKSGVWKGRKIYRSYVCLCDQRSAEPGRVCKRPCAIQVGREQLGLLQEGNVGVVCLIRCSQCQREQRAPQCPKTEGRSCFLDLWSTARLCSSMHPPAVSVSHPGSQAHSLRSQPFPFCSPRALKCYLLSFL